MLLVLIGYKANVWLPNQIKKLFDNYFKSFTIGQVTQPEDTVLNGLLTIPFSIKNSSTPSFSE
jgi:hypothetical protein